MDRKLDKIIIIIWIFVHLYNIKDTNFNRFVLLTSRKERNKHEENLYVFHSIFHRFCTTVPHRWNILPELCNNRADYSSCKPYTHPLSAPRISERKSTTTNRYPKQEIRILQLGTKKRKPGKATIILSKEHLVINHLSYLIGSSTSWRFESWTIVCEKIPTSDK